MNQPYYVDSVDDLCPSFKKLCIDKPVSERWSIVQYRSPNILRKQCHDYIEDALKHKKNIESQHDLIPLKLLIPNKMNKITITRLKNQPITIIDTPKTNNVDTDTEYDMNVD